MNKIMCSYCSTLNIEHCHCDLEKSVRACDRMGWISDTYIISTYRTTSYIWYKWTINIYIYNLKWYIRNIEVLCRAVDNGCIITSWGHKMVVLPYTHILMGILLLLQIFMCPLDKVPEHSGRHQSAPVRRHQLD